MPFVREVCQVPEVSRATRVVLQTQPQMRLLSPELRSAIEEKQLATKRAAKTAHGEPAEQECQSGWVGQASTEGLSTEANSLRWPKKPPSQLVVN